MFGTYFQVGWVDWTVFREGQGIVIGNHGSGCLPQPAGLAVNLIRRPAAKRLVGPRGVVEGEVVSRAGSRVGRQLVGLEVDLLVFHAAPQPLNKHVVKPMATALAVHADADTAGLEPADEFLEPK